MKDKILKLIHAYIQDDEAINAKPNILRSGYDVILDGVFIKNLKSSRKPSLYTSVYYDGYIWVTNGKGYSFNTPQFDVQKFDYYEMTFSFENQPPINIINRSKELITEQKGWGKKIGNFWGDISIELTFQFQTQDKPQHFLNYGTLEFELSDEEVADLHNKIEDRRLEIKKSAELAELNKRFEKYGIQ
jgi:hypothetical protein